MNTTIKNALGVCISLSVLLFGFGVHGLAKEYAKGRDQLSNRSFAVSAEGKAVAVPDVARFTYAVISEGGKDVSVLQEENTKKSSAVMKFVKEKGVDEKDIRTVSYQVTPQYAYTPCESGRSCPPPSISGYSVRNEVEVKVRDFSLTGNLLGGVVNSGANSVSEVSFTMDDPSSVESLAREEAVKKAIVKAKSLAKVADIDLGDILSIDEGYSASPYPVYSKNSYGMADMAAGAVSMAAPEVSPGSEEVVRTVTVRFSIE